ncbi:MAG: RluA family pseudouridine synthase [Phycisphaerales bacterium JB050]
MADPTSPSEPLVHEPWFSPVDPSRPMADPRRATLRPGVPPFPELEIVYQDDDVAIVNKPSGLLSVPGKGCEEDPCKADCVATRIAASIEGASGPLTAHRIDMDTSGILAIGLNKAAHRHLSIQFQDRLAKKTYIALLDAREPGTFERLPVGREGLINLPIRADMNNRPHQMHDPVQGRTARSQYTILNHETLDDGTPCIRVEFKPITGRSHQLRVHSAFSHIDDGPTGGGGLGAPIIGDHLYGERLPGWRLMLHARTLQISLREGEPARLFEANVPF